MINPKNEHDIRHGIVQDGCVSGGMDHARVGNKVREIVDRVVHRILGRVDDAERHDGAYGDEVASESDTDGLEMLVQSVLGDVLGEDVGRIVGAKDLSNDQHSVLDQMLDEQVSDLNVS